MWIVHPQSVTHCQRRLAAKFQFVGMLTQTDMHISEFTSGALSRGDLPVEGGGGGALVGPQPQIADA